MEKYFDRIITSDEVPKAKPYPDIIFKTCRLLKVKPEQVVLVGDTDSDVKADKAAGCIVVGVDIEGDYKIKTYLN